MSSLFEKAIERIDQANSEDPHTETVGGEAQPKELVYGRRMSDWVERLEPEPSEALRLAARAQHIRRWEIPRSDYPMDKAGYYKWRTTLYEFHADKAAEILRDVGYDDETIDRVRQLLQKKDLKTDPDMQTLEDAACLVFLNHHLGDFLERDDVDDNKAVRILQKTWRKMSERGHEAALSLPLEPQTAELVRRAVAG